MQFSSVDCLISDDNQRKNQIVNQLCCDTVVNTPVVWTRRDVRDDYTYTSIHVYHEGTFRMIIPILLYTFITRERSGWSYLYFYTRLSREKVRDGHTYTSIHVYHEGTFEMVIPILLYTFITRERSGWSYLYFYTRLSREKVRDGHTYTSIHVYHEGKFGMIIPILLYTFIHSNNVLVIFAPYYATHTHSSTLLYHTHSF